MDALLRLSSSWASITHRIVLSLNTMYHFILKTHQVHLIAIMH